MSKELEQALKELVLFAKFDKNGELKVTEFMANEFDKTANEIMQALNKAKLLEEENKELKQKITELKQTILNIYTISDLVELKEELEAQNE